jgi:hypothetical protein
MGKGRPARRSSHVVWNHLKLEVGKSIEGWLAGDWVGVDSHHVGTSKPCRSAVSDGVLECKLCAGELPLMWRAWVPIFDKAHTRWVTIVTEKQFERLEELRTGDPVIVTKTRHHGSALVVRHDDRRQGIKIGRGGLPAANLYAWFAHILKDPELVPYLKPAPEVPAPVRDLEIVTPESVIKVAGRISRPNPEEKPAPPAELREEISKFFKRAEKKPEKNGKH